MEDVTQKIKEMISSNKLKSEYKNSMNGIFGKDPIPNKVKSLHLRLCRMKNKIEVPATEMEIGEYDMIGFWKFIYGEQAKKTK